MDRGWIRDGTYPMPLKINFITLLLSKKRNLMRSILIALLMTIATQVGAGPLMTTVSALLSDAQVKLDQLRERHVINKSNG